MNGCLYAPSFIPGQGLQFDYKYLLIRESQKEARASFGRIKTDLVAVLFLWDWNNLALFSLEIQPPKWLLPVCVMLLSNFLKKTTTTLHFKLNCNSTIRFTFSVCFSFFTGCIVNQTCPILSVSGLHAHIFFINQSESIYSCHQSCHFDGVLSESYQSHKFRYADKRISCGFHLLTRKVLILWAVRFSFSNSSSISSRTAAAAQWATKVMIMLRHTFCFWGRCALFTLFWADGCSLQNPPP